MGLGESERCVVFIDGSDCVDTGVRFLDSFSAEECG